MSNLDRALQAKELIVKSRASIYNQIPESDPRFMTAIELESILNSELLGKNYSGLPLRTRSKVVKTDVCIALGFQIPKSFQKTQPRFPCLNFDTYIQQALNLQIWNEDIDGNRRYVLIRLDDSGIVTKVKVVSGDQLCLMDTTGTLTCKFQARVPNHSDSMLLSKRDTESVIEWGTHSIDNIDGSPLDNPEEGKILLIEDLYKQLLPLVGCKFSNLNAVQERNRGVELQNQICTILGYSLCEDDGQYPDIKNQLLEIKLQTSPTIDLGLHEPGDDEVVVDCGDKKFTGKDIRYAIFEATLFEGEINLDKLFLVNGFDFSEKIQLFGGKVKNSKIQIPLPRNFFD